MNKTRYYTKHLESDSSGDLIYNDTIESSGASLLV